MKKTRVGVLVSGNGTTLQALLDAGAAEDYPARIVLVASNNPHAFALTRAKQAGIATAVIESKTAADRLVFEDRLVEELRRHQVELVCLAGFMRLLGPTFLSAFPTVLNVHPALLPAFPGLHAPRQALSHGVKITGCTVHLVDEGTDTGPIVAQAAVPVLADDNEATLAARIQVEEHRLYPLAVQWIAQNAYTREGRGVRMMGAPVAAGLSLRNPGK